ncbi:MAG: tetratricopeptide repeat protein [Alphaproteobacteria bacterium]
MANVGEIMRRGADLHRQGRLDEARRCYQQVLARDPKQFDATHLSGLIWLQGGAPDRAEPLLRCAVELRPDIADVHLNLGKALGTLGKLDEAITCCHQALRLHPGHGNARADLAQWTLDAAARDADAALARDDLPAAQAAVDTVVGMAANLRNRGLSFRLALAYLRQGRLDDATAALLAPVHRLHDPDGALPPPVEPFATTSRAKLVHDIEQFRYLRARGVLGADYDRVIADYRAVLDGLPRTPGGQHVLTEAERQRLGPSYDRLVYLAPAPALAAGALNPDLDGPALEAAFHNLPPGIVWFDDFLRPEALTSLNRFCLESTIWWQLAFSNELGTAIRNGFACPLILQIAEELRALLPGLLADLEVRTIWAYKYYRTDSGLAMHADDGAVSLNFWLTPDAANLDPDSGGLLFWDHTQAPVGYFDTDDHGEKLRLLEQALAATPDAREHTLPYGQNRAALFNSKVLHKTDAMRFDDGYENRRVNVTMIFGELRR